MIDNIPNDDKWERTYEQLQSELGVLGWSTPGRPKIHYEREEGAPAWWHGDEEASQGFLKQMGVT